MKAGELEKIIELISGLGGKTLEGFMLYLGSGLLVHLMWASIVLIVVVRGYQLIAIAQLSDARLLFFCEIRDYYNIGSKGFLSSTEFIEVKKKINELVYGTKAQPS